MQVTFKRAFKVYETPQAFIEELNWTYIYPRECSYRIKPYVITSIRELLKDQGYKLWDWDVDSLDWQIQEVFMSLEIFGMIKSFNN